MKIYADILFHNITKIHSFLFTYDLGLQIKFVYARRKKRDLIDKPINFPYRLDKSFTRKQLLYPVFVTHKTIKNISNFNNLFYLL